MCEPYEADEEEYNKCMQGCLCIVDEMYCED
jgi:hypothetical protein